MECLFDSESREDIKSRVGQLRVDSERKWGTMTAAQMVQHCSRGVEMALGDSIPPRMFLGRILGSIIKPLALKDGAPMKPNSPTAPNLIVIGDRDLEVERPRLLALIDPLLCRGPGGMHHASAQLLRQAHAAAVVEADAQASRPSFAAVQRVAATWLCAPATGDAAADT